MWQVTSHRFAWPRRRVVVEFALPWLAAGVMCWFQVRPLRRYDLLVFLSAGKHVLSGASPYTGLHDPRLYDGSAFVYPWWTGVAFVPLSLLPVRAADLLWTTASIAAVVGACRLAGVRAAPAALVVLTAATTIRGLQVGSLNAFLLLGCVVAYKYRDRPRVVGTTLALVVGSKVFLFPLLVWLVVSRRWAAVRFCALVLGSLMAMSFLVGPIGPVDYAHLLTSLGAHEFAQGLSLHRLLAGLVSGPVATTLGAAAATVVVGYAAVQRRRLGAGSDLLLFTAGLVAALMLTPIVWSHYLVLLFAPVLLARPRLLWFLMASVLSWLISSPIEPTVLDLSSEPRILLLYAAMVGLLVAVARRPQLCPVPAPSREAQPPVRHLADYRCADGYADVGG